MCTLTLCWGEVTQREYNVAAQLSQSLFGLNILLFVILDREYLTLFALINTNVISIRGNVKYVPGCCMGYVV